jgi:uncharacterized phage-associated protein
MVSADDVAAEILARTGPLDTFKLQKLIYYCQAWHLVWEDGPLFGEPIEAWAGGPVVRELYERHRGRYSVSEWPWGDSEKLTDAERSTIEAVVDGYGKLSGRQLSQLTHRERPWRVARGDLTPGERGHHVIDLDELRDYYSALDQDEEAAPVDTLVADLS